MSHGFVSKYLESLIAKQVEDRRLGAEGATHFLAAGRRGWPLLLPPKAADATTAEGPGNGSVPTG
jgi:hypothetical protein